MWKSSTAPATVITDESLLKPLKNFFGKVKIRMKYKSGDLPRQPLSEGEKNENIKKN
jgi:hypothetical protein